MKNTSVEWLFAVLFLFSIQSVCAASSDDDWECLISSLCDAEMPESNLQELYELLEELRENPMDINSATRQQLGQLPFLSERQIEDIEAYVYMHGNMLSLGELQFIGSIDYNTRRFLSMFVYPGEGKSAAARKKSLRELFRYSRHTLLAKTEIPLYRRAGFGIFSDEELKKYPNRRYVGDILQCNLRYNLKCSDKISAGISMDKDAGEPYLCDQPLWIDYVSAFLSLDNVGCFDRIIIGNIKAGFGQGLVLNTGLSTGKSMALSAMDRQMNGFKPHSSTSETGYFTGLATTVSFGHYSLSVLMSHTNRDATLDSDGLVSSLKEDGYHRTLLERSKKNNLLESVYALHAGWQNNGMDFGVTLLSDGFDRVFEKIRSASQLGGWFEGRFWNISVDYSIRRGRFSFCGETAVCDNLSLATLNTLKLKVSPKLNLLLLYRCYGEQYSGFHTNGFAEGEISNERGIYVAASGRLLGLESSVYVDLFRFPAPRYRVSEPSAGFECQLEMNYAPRAAANEFGVRYRIKIKEEDCKATSAVEDKITGRLRLRWNHIFQKGISLQSQADVTHFTFPGRGTEAGFSLSESFSFQPDKSRFSWSVSASLFLTDSYDTSVSLYEKGLLYSFNFITLYGKGLRSSTVLKYELSKRMNISLKFGSTLYFDRESIGSSQQKIDGSHKEDISLQLRAKF